MKVSYISKVPIPKAEEVQGCDLREGIFKLILQTHPDFQPEDYISAEELNHFRRQYLTSLIMQERGELAAIDRDVLEAVRTNSILSENIPPDTDDELSPGQRVADKVASFGGSWTFIIAFFSFIVLWMAVNIYVLSAKPFDPYPFILLNLLLSCLAAIQAPIIMMSQNRQEQKDRQRSEHDYKVNLKAELEIRLLSEKLDHILAQQNSKLLEIQQIQTDYLNDLMVELRKK